MNKTRTTLGISLISVALLQGLAHADSSYEDLYFGNSQELELSESEFEALQKQKAWEKNQSIQDTYVSKQGGITFTYGAQTPTIVTSVLQITDVELEPGEIINSVNLGDSARWSVEPAVSGSGSSAIQHVLIKPLDVGLHTSMLIATDKRTYRMRLKSTRNDFMPYVTFVYPEKIQAAFEEKQRLLAKERDDNSITVSETGPKTYLGDLNFKYKVEGDVSWKPVRVFDDGSHTIIEMPETMKAQKAPALMLLLDEGGVFSDEVTELINYRLQGTRYVVDGIFDKAILTLDLDSNQQRVVITRES